jgi:hypothetical protein
MGQGKTTKTYLSNGSCVAVAHLSTKGQVTRKAPSASPNVTCPASFHRATRPCDLPCTIFR